MIALYFIITTIASVNLGLNLARQRQSESDVTVVRLSYDIVNALSMNSLFIRVMLNIANGYETEVSTVLSNTF